MADGMKEISIEEATILDALSKTPTAKEPQLEPVSGEGTSENDALLKQLEEAFTGDGDTFTFRLPKGDIEVIARIPKDGLELNNIRARQAKRWRMIERGIAPPAWRKHLPVDEIIVGQATFAESLLVKPRVTFVQALAWAHGHGNLLEQMTYPLLQYVTPAATQLEDDEIDEAGEV